MRSAARYASWSECAGPERLALVVRREAVGRIGQANLVVLGEPLERDEVVEPLVAGGRRDEQHRVGVVEPPDELDRQLDALARNDARGLHDEQSLLVHPELAAEPASGRPGERRGRG